MASQPAGTGADTRPAVTDAASAGRPVELAQLWADQFQHLTTLGVAGAGGVLVLLQLEMMAATDKWWLSVVLFAATAVLSLYGQVTVVDDATAGRPPGSKPRVLRGLALTCLGAASGSAMSVIV